MATKSYAYSSGRYQERAEYYYTQLPKDGSAASNMYLDIYRCVVNVYGYYHQDGIGYYHPAWASGLAAIRETQGLARCWGHASQVLDLMSEWRSQREADTTVEVDTSELAETLESLMDSLLEVLPCYVSWLPKVQNPENQALVEFLQNRGNVHRTMGNPKFYAYDRVVTNIASTAIPINSSNCIYIKGVGPYISQHIRDFLAGRAIPDVTPEQRVALTDNQIESLYNGSAPIVTDQQPTTADPVITEETMETESDDSVLEVSTDTVVTEQLMDNEEQGDAVVEKPPFMEIPMPAVTDAENKLLAEYLWGKSRDFYASGAWGYAWSWRRAAVTVCNAGERIIDWLDVLAEDTICWDPYIKRFPYIGEIMADVIREFYRHEPQEKFIANIPEQCPAATIFDSDLDLFQQKLLDMLWDGGFRELAVEIAAKEVCPMIKSEFKELSGCTPQAIQYLFAHKGNVPAARNWTNRPLIEWLWRCGQECPGPTAATYYNAARTVARKTSAVYTDDLINIKYIGPHIAERVCGELVGLVNPNEYRKMRKELNLLRRLAETSDGKRRRRR